MLSTSFCRSLLLTEKKKTNEEGKNCNWFVFPWFLSLDLSIVQIELISAQILRDASFSDAVIQISLAMMLCVCVTSLLRACHASISSTIRNKIANDSALDSVQSSGTDDAELDRDLRPIGFYFRKMHKHECYSFGQVTLNTWQHECDMENVSAKIFKSKCPQQ